jgi:hypothetical protein
MKNLIIIISLILATSTLNSCYKKTPAPTTDANDLPFATQTGANTFGCLVEGKPISTKGYYGFLSLEGIEFGATIDKEVSLKAITHDPRIDFRITFKLGNYGLGKHNVNVNVGSSYSSAQLVDVNGTLPFGNDYYKADSALPASVTITKAPSNLLTAGVQSGEILSGTFDLTLKNSSGGVIRITEGRFDFKQK